MNKPHVAFAIPSYGAWQAETSVSVIRAFSHFLNRWVSRGQGGVSLFARSGTIVSNVRNELVHEIINYPTPITHIMWIDSDMIIPPDIVERFLAHDVPMVAANYSSRRPPIHPVAWKADKRIYTTPDSSGLEEATFSGLGAALISTGVYKNLPTPWHKILHTGPTDYLGEDVYFFRKVKQTLNIPLWIDHDVSKEITHQGTHNFGMQDSLASRAEVEKKALFNSELFDVITEKYNAG